MVYFTGNHVEEADLKRFYDQDVYSGFLICPDLSYPEKRKLHI